MQQLINWFVHSSHTRRRWLVKEESKTFCFLITSVRFSYPLKQQKQYVTQT